MACSDGMGLAVDTAHVRVVLVASGILCIGITFCHIGLQRLSHIADTAITRLGLFRSRATSCTNFENREKGG